MAQPSALTTPATEPAAPPGRPPLTPTARTARRLLRHRGLWAGGALVLLIVLAAALAPVIAPYGPLDGDLVNRLQPPSGANWFGTDEHGRDIFSRIIFGSRLSLLVGVVCTGVALLLGTLIGALSGFFGGWWDLGFMRLMDIMLAFPSILLAIAITSILGPGLTNAMLAVGIVNVPIFARIVRSSVLAIKEKEFVESARATGVGSGLIIMRHILPNCLAPLIVNSTLTFATAILEAAGLSFLGLGAQPPAPEWGAMLSGAQNYIQIASWVVTFPGLAIMVNVLGFNLVGDGLRDLLDPRLADR